MPRKFTTTTPTEDHVGKLLANGPYVDWTLLSQLVNPVTKRHRVDFAAVQVKRTCLELHGIELKTSRHDWLGELRRPIKSGCWAALCHKFYVIAPAGVIRPEELPDGWGYIELRDDSVLVRREATERRPRMTAALCATLMRSLIRLKDTGFKHDFERLAKRLLDEEQVLLDAIRSGSRQWIYFGQAAVRVAQKYGSDPVVRKALARAIPEFRDPQPAAA